jgi:hypothetical protein
MSNISTVVTLITHADGRVTSPFLWPEVTESEYMQTRVPVLLEDAMLPFLLKSFKSNILSEGGKYSDTGIIPVIFIWANISMWITLLLFQPPLSHTSR